MESAPQEERNWAAICHLAAFAGLVIPFGNLLGPLVAWLIKRDDYPFVDDQGKESLNFQISVSLYFLGITLLLVVVVVGFAAALVADASGWAITNSAILLVLAGLALGLLGLVELVLVIVAAVRAGSGERFRYPLTIRFLR